MKLKNLLFGSTAGLMVVTGAQAADLPAAEPVEYVRVCDAFGTGFFYIPGTDTCLKIDGYARYEMHWVSDSDIYEYDPTTGGRTNNNDPDDEYYPYGHAESFNNFSTRTRGEVRFDARTMTDLGLLRSYIALRGTIGPTNSGSYSDGFNVDKAWLSLANDAGTLTAGHHGSFFDFFGGNAMNTRIGGDDPTLSSNLLAYTFGVGNGLSASISVEDKWFRRYGIGAGVYTTDTPHTGINTVTSDNTGSAGLFTTGNEGQEMPDFVANIRVDQGWGSAQIMGAVGRVGVAGNDTACDTGVCTPQDDIGWAVGAGASVNVPGTGLGFDIQGSWADGLVAYSTTGNGALLFDAVYTSADPIDDANGIALTEAWAIQASLTGDFSSTVSASLDGTYASVDHNGSLRNEDYDTWTVAGTVHWRPVSGLTISGEIAYENVDADGGSHYIVDDDVWGAMMRINRVF